MPFKQSTSGPFICKADVNGDSLEDIFIANSSGNSSKLYLQTTKGFVNKPVPSFEDDKIFEDVSAVFTDVDQDGDEDLFVISGGYEFAQNSSYYADRVYLNDGKGNFKKSLNSISESNKNSNGKTITTLDFDNDGDEDIVIGNHYLPSKYPNYHPSVLLENNDGVFVDVTSTKASVLQNIGAINSLLPTDYNVDGKTDLIAVGEWTGIHFLKNTGTGFEADNTKEILTQEKGWWFSITEMNLNNDNIPDYIVGNVGLNLKFKTKKTNPLKFMPLTLIIMAVMILF